MRMLLHTGAVFWSCTEGVGSFPPPWCTPPATRGIKLLQSGSGQLETPLLSPKARISGRMTNDFPCCNTPGSSNAFI